jgi:hypothetical protein
MPQANLRAIRSAAQTASRVHRWRELGPQATGWLEGHPTLPASCFILLSLFCVAAMVSASALGSRDCRTKPVPLAIGHDADVSITLPANTPCTILVHAGDITVDDIAIHVPPERGTLTSRARTGVVYRPLPGFKGNDSFSFSLRGGVNAIRRTSVVRVHAVVD